MPRTQWPARVVLVRHGATDWAAEGRHTGWADVPLNARGREQASALAPELALWSFSTVLCSPLQRALATAQAAGLGNATIDPDLREWNYGDYEGLTSAQIRERRPGWTLWNGGVEGGETLDDVAVRADRVIARLRESDGDAALVAHGHLLRVLAARWVGQAPTFAQFLTLSTATLSVIGWEQDWPSITLWNSRPHGQGGGRR